MLDADIRDFFTSLDHRWLVRFLGAPDRGQAGPAPDRQVVERRSHRGRGRGRRARRGRRKGHRFRRCSRTCTCTTSWTCGPSGGGRRHARGDVIIVRWADDFVVGFEHREDAERFLADLRERFAKFGLELHPDKTRLIEFGRYAARDRAGAGARQAGDVRLPRLHARVREDQETGGSGCERITISKRMRAKLRAGQDRAASATGISPSRSKGAGWQRGAGAPRLLRRARQHRRGSGLPHPGHAALVQGAAASQPAHADQLGADEPHRDSMATARPHEASLPGCAVRRQNPRQEPSALVSARWDLRGGPPARAVPTANGGSGLRSPACGTDRFVAEPCASFWSATISPELGAATTAVMGSRW